MEAAAAAVLLLLAVTFAHGHLYVRRWEEAKLDVLRPFDGRVVTLSVGYRMTTVVTGVLVAPGPGRSVMVLAGRPRRLPLGEVHDLVDAETGQWIRL